MASISNTRLAELLSAEKRMYELELRSIILNGMPEFLNAVDTLLANTPYQDWPPLAKAAFQRQPSIWRIAYRSKLPISAM